MEMLHKLDPIAYVRYASVYREFKAVDDFIEEIQILERKQSPGANQPELFNAT
jgi:transcriptional repressor NrdR